MQDIDINRELNALILTVDGEGIIPGSLQEGDHKLQCVLQSQEKLEAALHRLRSGEMGGSLKCPLCPSIGLVCLNRCDDA